MWKRWWVGWNVRLHLAGDQNALKRLHWVRDPWKLGSSEERIRFEATTRLIRDCFGNRLRSVLEIGCAEGLQTKYLSPIADRIVGIDVSDQAIERARRRKIRNARFIVSDLSGFSRRVSNGQYDLATACEVLYYCPQFDEIIRTMNRIAKSCLVTYYEGQSKTLDPFFEKVKGCRTEMIRGPKTNWKVVWWTNAHGFGAVDPESLGCRRIERLTGFIAGSNLISSHLSLMGL